MKEVHKMKVIVFIKQIPDSSDVKLDENGNLIRSGVGTMINPVDKNALELGLTLRDRFGGSVTAVTMGPPQAKDVLKRALFMGCDKAVLLSDRIFGGADTLATGYVLSMAAKKLGDFDLAIFGNKASDAETAQTGPVTAGFLGLPLVTSVEALELDGNAIVCRRSFTGGTETSKAALPAVITVTPAVNTPRFMTPANVIDGLKKGITVWDCADLGCDEAKCGVKGSPSRTKCVTEPTVKKVDGTVINGSSDEAAEVLAGVLADMHLI